MSSVRPRVPRVRRVRPLPFRLLFKRTASIFPPAFDPSPVSPASSALTILAFNPAVAKYEHADDRGQAAAASATREELKDLLRAVLERSSNLEGPDRSASERALSLIHI